MRRRLIASAILIASSITASAQERHTHGAAELGVVSFANSGAPAAQAPFQRGIALLHSFEYAEAAEAFRAASTADRNFAMAYWAEALTYTHPLWGEDDPAAARRALARLGPTPAARLAKAGTPRERAYGAAIEAFYRDTDLATRARAFADSMRHLSATYSNDVDAAAFTALALLTAQYVGNLPAAEGRAARDDAITITQRIFGMNPRHPGAAHYLIHATDDPTYAARGLEAARKYAEIAPAAEHALHMPSHIFLQLGLWDDDASSNERAWAASRAEVRERKLSNAELSFHTLQWLQYAYLQQGRYRAARALIDTARAVLAGLDLALPTYSDARYAVRSLEFLYAANTGDWNAACASATEPPKSRVGSSDRERGMHAAAAYQTAIIAMSCGKTDAPSIQFVKTQAQSLPADDPSRGTYVTMQAHIDALAAAQRSDFTRMIEVLQPAAAAAARPPVGPPGALRTHELLGEALLQAGRAQDAVAAYERALQLTPKRASALLGLARAKRAARDSAGASAAYRQLLANWHAADPGIPGLDEARRLTAP
jgi:tetratricopeptide (TPR) repeat protein